jgi:hypothetical protein
MKNRKERKNRKRIWLQKLKAVIVSLFVLTGSLAVPLAVRLLHAGGRTVVDPRFLLVRSEAQLVSKVVN